VTVEELLDEMRRSVDGLGEDGASRADLKLLSRTLKELRHAFWFFAGLRGRSKATVFGSARLSAGFPAYRQAESFGKAMARSGWFVVTGVGEGSWRRPTSEPGGSTANVLRGRKATCFFARITSSVEETVREIHGYSPYSRAARTGAGCSNHGITRLYAFGPDRAWMRVRRTHSLQRTRI
jgi:hypothetical protein